MIEEIEKLLSESVLELQWLREEMARRKAYRNRYRIINEMMRELLEEAVTEGNLSLDLRRRIENVLSLK